MAVTASFNPSSGVLSIFGDALDNNIVVSRNTAGAILVNSGAVPVQGGTPTVANTTLIQVFGLASNDTLTINEAFGALPRVNIFGGAEDDVGTGGSGADQLFGQAGSDTLHGQGGSDFLSGGDDSDVIFGGVGNDQMRGENGDDRLIWNSGDGTDLVEGGDGADTAEVNGSGGAEVFSISANIDRVRVDGLNPELFFLDMGTVEKLELNAGDGDDVVTMTGALGALIAIRVNGEAGDDTISAADGNDVLDGGSGADRLKGGLGDDIYIVDTQDDVVVEIVENGGADRVMARVGYTLAADDDIELLTTTSASGMIAINLTGNALAQEIFGNAGVNTLKDGGGAGDVLRGFGGNDTYLVYSAATTIVEISGQGNADRVLANVDYALESKAHIEHLATTNSAGTADIDLTGNALGQQVTGNAGGNRIDGKAGSDVLRGFGGDDTFVFSTALGAGNVDTIVDFNSADDRMLLSDAVFTALATGVLAASAFRINTSGIANDATDRIIYQRDSGKLFYDADGAGGVAAIHFATLTGQPALAAADFSVA